MSDERENGTNVKNWNHKRRVLAGALFAIVAIVIAVVWARSGNHDAKTGAKDESSGTAEKNHPEGPNAVRIDSQAQTNIGLQVAVAQVRTVTQTIRTTGSVGPNETRIAHIRPITRGRILKVPVRVGDQVRAGQVLATYDNIELGEALGQYGVLLATLKKAQTEAEVARRSMERAKNLVELGAVARAELERRTAEYANAQSSIDTQRAELARIEEKLHRFGLEDPEIKQMTTSGVIESHREVSQTNVRAPFNGVITNLNVVEGETVETDREMFTVADLSVVWVQANIYETDIRVIRKGVPATVSVDAYPGETFTGQITYISDILDPKTRTVKVRCEVPNPSGRLKLDMFVTVEIPTPTGRSAVMIPATAIQQINDQPVVFVRLNAKDFQRRLVQIGARDGDFVEVASGVKAGESVVTHGSFQLKSIALRDLIGEQE